MNELIAGVRADVAIKLFGDDLDQLLETGQAVEEVAGGIVGAQDVKLEQVTGLPMLSVTPDRDKLARYGVSMETVQDAVSTATGGRQAGELCEGDRRFDVVVRLPEVIRTDFASLGNLPVAIPACGFVPLPALADISLDHAPDHLPRPKAQH